MKIMEKLKRKLKKRKTYPDMPEDPKALAKAMFWPNDHKLKEKRRAAQDESLP